MIFCVEDDKDIRDLIIYALEGQGYEVKGFDSYSGLSAAISDVSPELFILDIMLPDLDGVEILKRLRKRTQTKDTPVIMLTAKGSEYDKIYGLESGADDYITKPFSVLELIARVKAIFRRAKAIRDDELNYGKLVMYTSEREIRIDGKPAELTYKEYEVLRLFLENPGRVFSREKLLETVWGYDYEGETRTVDVHIASLRQKLGEYGASIITVRGVGYKLENRT